MNGTIETMELLEKYKFSRAGFIFHLFVLCLWLVLTIGTGKLYHKYRHKLQPTHIFELSVLADILADISFGYIGLGAFQRFFTGFHPFCLLANFLAQTIR